MCIDLKRQTKRRLFTTKNTQTPIYLNIPFLIARKKNLYEFYVKKTNKTKGSKK